MQQIDRRQLHRGSDRVIGGVCSGLAEYFSVDPLLVRVVFVLLAVAQGAGVVLYLLLWLLLPEAGSESRAGAEVLGAGLRSMEADLRRVGAEIGSAFGRGAPPPPPAEPPRAAPPDASARRNGIWLGVLLIAAGALVFGQTLGVFWWWDWAILWPLLLIGLGVLILARRLR